jgi:hypothetical protein
MKPEKISLSIGCTGLIGSIFLIMTFVSSCEYLNVEPESDLVEEEFWKKTEDIEAVLAATYDAFRETSLASFIWGELRADMATFKGTINYDYLSIKAVNIKTNNPKIEWKGYYNTINLANTILFYAPRIQEVDKTFTPEIRNGIEAEAIFLRSLSYFYLVRVWKDVPLVLQPSVSDTIDFFPPKTEEHVVIQQIIKDLEDARSKAFTTKFYNNPVYFKGRANRFSIMALLADVYLWNEQYDKCIAYCDSLIGANQYFRLMPTLDWFTMFYPGNSMESIFEIQYDASINQINPIYYDQLPITRDKNVALSNIAQSIFTDVLDIRKCGTSPTWKYIGASQDFKTSRQASEEDANIIYYRLADIYLMKAEALIELNQITEANEILRTIAERAAQPYEMLTSQDRLREYVLTERARELAFEGKRWFDLLRYAKRNSFERKNYLIEILLQGSDIKQRPIYRARLIDTMSYFLPIPENDILFNPSLRQNPYYDR